jgi:hypothetical protein
MKKASRKISKRKSGKRLFKHAHHPVVWLVFLGRAFQSLTIPFFPFWGYAWAVFFDALDCHILRAFTLMDSEEYHQWDKVMDLCQEIMVVVTAYLYSDWGWVFGALFLQRFLTTLFFLRQKNDRVFLYSPNFLEVAYLFLLVQIHFDWVKSMPFVILAGLILILILLKFFHEYILHSYWDYYLTPFFTHFRKKVLQLAY